MDEKLKVTEKKSPTEVSAHILLVDDEKFVRDLIREILTILEYKVTCCEDGEKAVQYFKKSHHTIDVVILDMTMPNMSGYDCFYKLKEINSSVPVIISSAYSHDSEVQEIMDKGAKAFVEKPYSLGKLDRIISEILKTENHKKWEIG